jgi:hypothetical protein
MPRTSLREHRFFQTSAWRKLCNMRTTKNYRYVGAVLDRMAPSHVGGDLSTNGLHVLLFRRASRAPQPIILRRGRSWRQDAQSIHCCGEVELLPGLLHPEIPNGLKVRQNQTFISKSEHRSSVPSWCRCPGAPRIP